MPPCELQREVLGRNLWITDLYTSLWILPRLAHRASPLLFGWRMYFGRNYVSKLVILSLQTSPEVAIISKAKRPEASTVESEKRFWPDSDRRWRRQPYCRASTRSINLIAALVPSAAGVRGDSKCRSTTRLVKSASKKGPIGGLSTPITPNTPRHQLGRRWRFHWTLGKCFRQ